MTAARQRMTMAGFTAIAIIVLAALAYSIRISLDPADGSDLLTWTFLAANIAGWLLGALLRRRNRDSLLGFLLVLLGDAVFPLNLYAPLVLYVSRLRGDAPLAATAVILIGIAYHLYNYRHRERMRFALPFYPYFFAFASGALLVLAHYTLGLAWSVAAWALLVFATLFQEMTLRRRPEPPRAFADAAAVLLLASVIVSAWALRDGAASLLAAIVIGTAILIVSTLRRSDPLSGCASWLALTTLFTALLYWFHSPLWLYVVATGAWTVVLCIVSTREPRAWSEPFHESAWWTAILLAAGLTIALSSVWIPLLVRTAAPHDAMRGAAAIGLAELGIAMATVSVWRRRYPPIAATMQGFVVNNALLRATSYAAPLMLLLALTGIWPHFGPQPANVYAPLAFGTLILIFGPRLERFYPIEALDFAGIIAMIFASFNALASAIWSAAVLFAAALIFLVRWLRGAGVWTYGAALVLATAGAVILPGTLRGLALAGLAALLVVLLPWIRQTPLVVKGTNWWAVALAVASFFLLPLGAPATTVAFLVLAVALIRGSGMMARDWTAHAAGLLFWFSLARFYGFGAGDEPLVAATWAWIVFLSRVRRSVHAVLAIAAVSIAGMMLQTAIAPVIIIALLLLAALLLEIRPFRHMGLILLAAAVAVAANGEERMWIVATLAVAAAVLLWESLAKQSTFAHLFFIAAAAAAAYLAMPLGGPLRVLPIAVLLTLVLLVELALLQLREPSTVRGDLTAAVALLLAIGIVVVEVASARYSIYVLGLVFLAVVAIRPLLPAPVLRKVHRLQPMVQRAFLVVGPLIGAAMVAAIARMAGLGAGRQLFAVACCSLLVLFLPRTRIAFHFLALAVYVAAALLVRAFDPFVLAACLTIAAGYLAWRFVQPAELLEHCAAVGAIEAIVLWGMARRVTWPEYYLFAVAAYLCILLLRDRPRRVANALAVMVIAMAIAYPLFALLQSGQDEHTVFLGLAGILVIHVLLTSARNRWMVGAVCAMLGFGMLYAVAVLRSDTTLNLLMAAVGFVVIADIGLLQQRHSMRELEL